MAGPPNPFAGLAQAQSQRNGTTARGGRGGRSRPSPFQPRNPNAPPSTAPATAASGDIKPRGRGRGRAPSTRGFARGRGAGTAYANASRNKPESNIASESPFAQLKQNKPTPSPSPAPSPFGGQASQIESPFALNGTGGHASFGTSGFGELGVTATKPVMNGGATGAVPIEDASILNSYNERYEQVGVFGC